MCGIFGYVGEKNAVEVTISGLKKLEYRGYDSSGIAALNGTGKIHYCKEVGKISEMEKAVKQQDFHGVNVALAHTRWATHGAATRENAHPHLDSREMIALVHNGIIENYDSLREMLIKKGYHFKSQTDTEVIVQLISSLYKGDLLKAVQQAMPLLKGAFAIALLHKDHPNMMVCAAQACPLAIGIGNNEAFIASDTNAFLSHTREVIFLENSEVAVVKANSLQVFDESSSEVMKQSEKIDRSVTEASKGSFEHYTLKEIFEQPQSIRNALLARFLEDYGTVTLEGMNMDVNQLLAVQRIIILACGTSYHAGYAAAYMLEDKARIPVQVEVSSEFRYKNPVVPDHSLVIAISQSGETADTLAAVRELKAKGALILAVCNVQGSSLMREAHGNIFLRAGPEIGVCSTKAFTSQIVVLSLFTLLMARMRHMGKKEGQDFIHALAHLPAQVQEVLDQAEHIQAIARKYAKYQNFFFIGRHYMYPASLEGALKLKEISYINANGYPAGELKHGPIALIGPECPTVAMCANKLTYDKIHSNLMEIKARKGPLIAIAARGQEGLEKVADEIIWVPDTCDELLIVASSVAAQLFAYYVAKIRGTEIDQPRNLAKSVTVE